MRKLLVILLCFALLAGCNGGSSGKSSRKKLTTRQRDSVLSRSKLPGAKVVGKAISVSDTAAARAKRIDDLSK